MALKFIINRSHYQVILQYDRAICELVQKIHSLKMLLQEIQGRCKHTFIECSSSNDRTCVKCRYIEVIHYKFPNINNTPS